MWAPTACRRQTAERCSVAAARSARTRRAARVAPPERDLWSLDPGDGSVHAAYTAGTGTELRPRLLELYRRRWDLADVAVGVARFRRRHVGSVEDAKSFEILGAQVAALSGLDDR